MPEHMTEETAQRLVASLDRLSEVLEKAQLTSAAALPSLPVQYPGRVAGIIAGGPEELQRINKLERGSRKTRPSHKQAKKEA